MKGLLLPNLDVHLSLQAPSKGCSKNPGKKESPMDRILLQACFTEELKQACPKRQLRQDSTVQWHPLSPRGTQHTAWHCPGLLLLTAGHFTLHQQHRVWHQVKSQSTSYTFSSTLFLPSYLIYPILDVRSPAGLTWKTAGSKHASRKDACINLCQPVRRGLSLLPKHMLWVQEQAEQNFPSGIHSNGYSPSPASVLRQFNACITSGCWSSIIGTPHLFQKVKQEKAIPPCFFHIPLRTVSGCFF